MVLLQVGFTQSNFASRLAQITYQYGIYDVILPFLLIFTLVYAMTMKLPFVKEHRNSGIVLSLGIGLLFIYPHLVGVPPTSDPVAIINQLLPGASLVFIAIMLILITLGISGFSGTTDKAGIYKVLVSAGILIILGIYVVAAGWWANMPPWLNFLRDSDLQDLLIVLIVFGLIVSFVTSSGPEADADGKRKGQSAFKWLTGDDAD